jgi:hypothetical protein
MPEHVSTLQLAGVVFLAVASLAWLIGLTRLVRQLCRPGVESAAGYRAGALMGLPHPRQAGPPREAVELTPAEQDAFAGLVRRLGHG